MILIARLVSLLSVSLHSKLNGIFGAFSFGRQPCSALDHARCTVHVLWLDQPKWVAAYPRPNKIYCLFLVSCQFRPWVGREFILFYFLVFSRGNDGKCFNVCWYYMYVCSVPKQVPDRRCGIYSSVPLKKETYMYILFWQYWTLV